MKAVLRGGPHDGLQLEISSDTRVVRVPVLLDEYRVLTSAEVENPDNWEVVDGRLRLKQPKIGAIDYVRTDAIDPFGFVIFQ